MAAVAQKVQKKEATEFNNVSNHVDVALGMPFQVKVKIRGTSNLLFHRWDNGVVASKSAAHKNSKEKKTDNLESFVYRDPDTQFICIPGEYLRMSMVYAAKNKQDPRSPRKSAFELFKAGVVVLDELVPINQGVKKWDFEDSRRVTIQKSAITRTRPGFRSGWEAEFNFLVIAPEYIDYELFNEVLGMAGRFNGIGDFRPTHGRFQIMACEIVKPKK